MKKLAIILALFLTGNAWSQVVPIPVLPMSSQVINPANGHIYVFLSKANWTDSEAMAVSLGGHLATIRNQQEEDWIYSFFAFYGGCAFRNLWIGLNDAGTPGQFVWVSGEPVTYTNWGDNQPSGTGHYAAIISWSVTPATWAEFPDQDMDFGFREFNGIAEIIPKKDHDKDEKEHKDKKDKD